MSLIKIGKLEKIFEIFVEKAISLVNYKILDDGDFWDGYENVFFPFS